VRVGGREWECMLWECMCPPSPNRTRTHEIRRTHMVSGVEKRAVRRNDWSKIVHIQGVCLDTTEEINERSNEKILGSQEGIMQVGSQNLTKIVRRIRCR
jgi:hypothetical protein